MEHHSQDGEEPGTVPLPERRRRIRSMLVRFLPAPGRFSRRRLASAIPSARKTDSETDLTDACRAVCDGVNGAMPGLERAFLGVGEKMEAMDACSRRMLDSCERLEQLAGRERGGAALVGETLAILKGPLDYIDYCMKEHERLIGLVERCEKKTQAMLGIRGRMHDVIAPLTFMAILFKIESAYLQDDMRETFATVTSEVERLHKLVDETFAKNAEQLDEAYRTLAGVRRQLEEEFRRQAKIVAVKREHIEQAVRNLDAQVSRNAERDDILRRQGQELAGQVSKVVIGVQFQDIVKQKCDHVVQALGAVGAAPGVGRVRLELHQLRSVEKDLDTGCSDIRQGFGNITRFAESLHQSSMSKDSFASMTAAMDGMVQSLLDALREVHDIIGMVARLTEKGHAAVLPANGIASNLDTAISELSINMRLIALNAQIRSVQGGQGTGLETLAARTAEISDDINAISGKVALELADLHQSIDEMLGTFDQFLGRGREENARLGEGRGGMEARLHELRDQTLAAVGEIGTAVDGLGCAVKEADALLDGFPGICAEIKGSADRLEAVLPEASAAEFDEESLSALEKRYTMASERKVHAEVVASAGGRPAPAQPPEVAKAPADGGVELF